MTLWKESATSLAAMIRNKEVSSREVVDAHLRRIEAVNPKLNAVTIALEESALAAADRADASAPTGPLHGVPFSIKENIDCVGSPTTSGVTVFAEAMPPIDSPVVTRMKAAGAIPLARTNMPEMGLRITTDNPLRGRTLNPWTQTRTAGGSSGGEGSAIAAGMSPIGLGNDIGGSVRNPAVCCGIASLKPSAGRIPHALSLPPSDNNGLAGQLMAVEGPMARHIADVKLGYEILSGRDPRDPVSVDAPLYAAIPDNRQVALVTDIPGITLPDYIVASVRRAGEALTATGWQTEEVSPPELERVTELWGHVLTDEFAPVIDQFGTFMSAPAVGLLQKLIEMYPPENLPSALLHAERWRLCKAWSEFFAEYPLVVGPTWTDIPFEHDADLAEDGAETTVNRLRFITPANLLSLPSAAVPTGVHDGFPMGVQVLADRWRDDLSLEGAAAIERSLGAITPIDPVF